MSNALRRAQLALLASALAIASVGAQIATAATVTASDGNVSVTTTAPDTVVVGKEFVATVQVQNIGAATIGAAGATLQYPRSAMKVKALSTPTAGAVCEKATSRGTVGFAACGNVTLQPGATVTTQVTLIATAVGTLGLGSYAYTAASPFVQGTFTFAPSLVVNSTK